MKFKSKRKQLLDAVINVERATSEKSSLQVLEGIYLKTKGDRLHLKGYNLNLGIETFVEIQAEKDGEIILNARVLSDILKKLPEEEVNITTDEKNITQIKSGESEFSIVGINGEDYPEIPTIKENYKFNISSEIIKDMIRQTIFATSDNDTNPVHMGTLFEVKNGLLTLVSVDGYRLALRKENINLNIEESKEIKFIVPANTLSEILKLATNDKTDINIHLGEKHIIFKINDYEITSRLLEGKFLDYKSAIPTTNGTTVEVKTKELIDSVERVSLIITDRLKSPLRCIFNENKIKISSNTTIGKANDQILAPINGEGVEIGFNNKYLLDAIKNCETDEIKISLNGSLKPMKIMPKEGDAFIFLVLPVRLKNE